MAKIDFKKELKSLYQPSTKAVVDVEVPPLNFLMIDGRGNPNTRQDYAQAVAALYALAYALKFAVKKQTKQDYAVMPLEGLWWTDDMSQFSVQNKEAWQWTMMMMQPEYVTAALFKETLPEVAKKKNPTALTRIRFERYVEGLSAQIMHIGPYAEEGPTVAKVHDFILQGGHQPRGKHHEIYLGDPRKTTPEKLKTIIRQPFA